MFLYIRSDGSGRHEEIEMRVEFIDSHKKPMEITGTAANPNPRKGMPNETIPSLNSTRLPGERFPQTRLYVLAPSDLNHFDNDSLRYAINEMYARHGADFKNEELRRLFAAHSWYKPVSGRTYDQTEELFTELETTNLKALGQLRDSRNSGMNRGK